MMMMMMMMTTVTSKQLDKLDHAYNKKNFEKFKMKDLGHLEKCQTNEQLKSTKTRLQYCNVSLI